MSRTLKAREERKMDDKFTSCGLCPRNCKSNRVDGKLGICQVPATLKVARAALHFWEEPCISGTNGSGTVFFSGCPLHCVYCQNQAISYGRAGKDVLPERLVEIFLELQEKQANNINLVTPTQYAPHIAWVIEQAKRQGLQIPIVYNTSGYETVDTLKQLEGLVDIYLPDFKYYNSQLAQKYSKAPDYPEVVKKAIAEMVRQQPNAEFIYDKSQDMDIMKKGVIVRQLLLPGQLEDAKQVTKYLYDTYQNQIFYSLMSQYTPLEHAKDFPELTQKVSQKTYDKFVDYAISLGVENGFIQEGEVAEESFIPNFDSEGV